MRGILYSLFRVSLSPRKILVSFFPFPPTPPRLFSNPPACSVSFSSSFFMHSASSFYRARQRPARGARLRRGYCRAKRGGRAARATEGASLSVARSAAGVFRALCAGETLEARQTASYSPRVAVRRGTRGTAMALWAHQMPVERRSPLYGPLTMPATRKRLYEGGEGLGGDGPPSAPRRPRGFGGEQPPTARRARPGGRTSRGPGQGRGRSALLGQRYARPQAAKKITRKFLGDL